MSVVGVFGLVKVSRRCVDGELWRGFDMYHSEDCLSSVGIIRISRCRRSEESSLESDSQDRLYYKAVPSAVQDIQPHSPMSKDKVDKHIRRRNAPEGA